MHSSCHTIYQKYPYLNYTFFDGQQTYGYINQKTCILTENGYQEIAGDFLEILDHTQDDIDIVCAFHPQEKLDEILEIQKQIHQKYVGIHATLNVVYLDITVDCTKGSGLKKLCSLLNQEVISYCIGDSYNDLDMFDKDLWTCVAMGNACDSLKEKAAYITDNNVDDGIYHICEKMGWF